jgi:hypothetical protein
LIENGNRLDGVVKRRNANLFTKGLIEKPPGSGVVTKLFKKGLIEKPLSMAWSSGATLAEQRLCSRGPIYK